MKRRQSFLPHYLVLIGLTSTVGCMADDPTVVLSTPADETIVPEVLMVSDNHVLYAISDQVQDKEVVVQAMDKEFGGDLRDGQTTKGAGPTTISDEGSINFGNGRVYARFSSDIDTNFWDTWLEVSSGSSRTAWTGTDPQYNSSKVRLEDSFTCSGVTSISADGFGVSGNTASWSSGDISNTWYLNHIYSGVECSGAITQFTQTTNGSHFFESSFTWVTPSSTDSVYW